MAKSDMARKILVIDDDAMMLTILSKALDKEGYDVYVAKNGTEGLALARASRFDLVICDINMPDVSGFDVLREIKRTSPSTMVINITAFGSIKDAVKAVHMGAVEYVVKPFPLEEMTGLVGRLFNQGEESGDSSRHATGDDVVNSLVCNSEGMKKVFSILEKCAPSESNILITGENGTGKDLVARYIHLKSPRRDKIFLPVNCAAIPSEMFEGEMFGHEKGAFTGASRNREGMFSLANGGTLFLDEVTSMPPELQGKMLRALESREIMKVGGSGFEPVDIRVLAATNVNLAEHVANNRFRKDLYYRLKVFEVNVPPLRERVEDIEPLCSYYVSFYNKRLGKTIREVGPAVVARFKKYGWPGNVRELKNVIERGMILCDSDAVGLRDIPMELFGDVGDALTPGTTLKDEMHNYEKTFITKVLQKVGNDRKKAAELMGIGLSSLYRKMEELGIKSNSPPEN
ncbi:MAG: sigma-54-dependent Fis family transcriptional regulator [Nitrospinae bacterium]|nr:sigma-54-dependent Fis family transcriptional regulator [Nitrospinota bacterium]